MSKVVARINALEKDFQALSDDELRDTTLLEGVTTKLFGRYGDGTTIDSRAGDLTALLYLQGYRREDFVTG